MPFSVMISSKSVSAPPLYTSKRTAKSLWQQYRVCPDRLELESWFLFHTMVIPAHEIQWIEVRPSILGNWPGFTLGIKLDNADFCRHVLVRRKSGFFKRIAFTPDDPERFVEICKSNLPIA
jgi:hypothetical protein